jgi:sucrose-phosphate synthase
MVGQSQNQLYILLISIHGLIRGHNLDLGRDADTGGQTKYVVELAKALVKLPEVGRVDLVTRRVVNSGLSPDYASPIEQLADNAQIIRIETGPEEYIHKEDLWDHLDSFADNLINWLHRQPRLPDVLHSHYADAGYVGVLLAHLTGLPLVYTGHSLGREKCRQLLATGLQMHEIESRYHMSRRINAEEDALSNANLVITSTRNEIEEQYGLYDYYMPEKMVIIPPGTDLMQFHPPKSTEESYPFTDILKKFLQEPDKPIILAISRADERKNILSLLEAYGESPRLQELANLVIVAGNRDDIRELDEGAQTVLTEILLGIDNYDLYGRVAIPKQHKTGDVADMYRLAVASKGVFINPALTEPFGLTLLEAAASGLPLVATENGGPVDIIGNCHNGLLVDPLDKSAIAEALLEILENPNSWQQFSESGIQNVARYYSWDAHAQAYIEKIRPFCLQPERITKATLPFQSGHYRTRAIVTDIDQNLLGDREGLNHFAQYIRQHRKQFLFAIATGRRLDSALAILKQYQIPIPDILITSLGTEVYYAPQLISDIAWSHHIDHLWTPRVLRRIIGELPGFKQQVRSEQSRFKLSYEYDSDTAPSLDAIFSLLRQRELSVNPILSFGQFFDLIPARASKGQALRYVAQQWNIPLERILVAGGSGADEDMLRGNTLGVVVANRHREELSMLGEMERIYFADRPYAWGILEAIEHYDFFNL